MPELFENAVLSIQMGVEDFQSDDERRPVSALRNFYAGVLLLGKQCLLEAAPGADPMEVLASRFAPVLDSNGELAYAPKGAQTIDLAEMRERFKGFGLNWPAGNIQELQTLRNTLEHYHSSASKDAIRQGIASCFPLVEGFFAILERSPKAELGEAWDVMLAETKFFAQLKSACDATFAEISWWDEISERSAVCCPACGSSLVYQEDADNSDPAEIKGRCKACGGVLSAEETVEILIEAQFGVNAYLAAKDGLEPDIHDCPECGNADYVETGETVKCFFCDYAIEGECARCGTSFSVSNMSVNNSNLCDYCDHMSLKDD